MLNGVNQSSFRSFRGFKENICARFFCNQSENCEHTHGLVKMQQIPPQFSGGGSCPWLFVNISFKVKLAHCYLLSSPFSGASHSKFDWNCFFSVSLWSFAEKTCRIVFRGHLWTKRCMWRILPASETKPEWQKRLHQWKRVLWQKYRWPKYLPSFKYEMRNCGKCTRLEREWGSGEREDLLSEIFSQLRIWRTAELR